MKSRSSTFAGLGRRAFTLVEMMVSIALLLLLMVVTVTILNSVASINNRARAKVDTFREARAGFDVMTRRVSQSMLNTYWDYFDAAGRTAATCAAIPTPFVAFSYGRQSELHFVTGPTKLGAKPLLPDPGMLSVTHSIFFQSPQGLSTDPTPAIPVSANLPSLLNVSGYFIEYTTDKLDRPVFLQAAATAPPERWRFRLIELDQGCEYFQVYRSTGASTPATALDWFRAPLNRTAAPSQPACTRVLAENVIALLVLPHRSPNDPAPTALTELSPNYYYDSREWAQTGKALSALPLLTKNQLPPMVQVTMVVLDEVSAQRLQTLMLATPQTMSVATDLLGLTTGATGLFTKASAVSNPTPAQEKAQYKADLATLEAKLIALKLTYRIFNTEVSILQAKWSE